MQQEADVDVLLRNRLQKGESILSTFVFKNIASISFTFIRITECPPVQSAKKIISISTIVDNSLVIIIIPSSLLRVS